MAASGEVVGDDMVEKMKENLRLERVLRAAAAPPAHATPAAAGAAKAGGASADGALPGAAESLKMLADGVQASCPLVWYVMTGHAGSK